MITLKTNYGDIKLTLHKDATPNTVENFLSYIKEGFYSDTLFHRVIPGFMIQGGGFESGLVSKKTNAPIENEAAKGHKNMRGTVAMARTSDPHSATSQFFINVADNNFLDYKSDSVQGYGYCVFAEVAEGMEIVDKIATVKTTSMAGHQDVPSHDVIIESVVLND